MSEIQNLTTDETPRKVDDMIFICERLVRILRIENTALDKGEFASIGEHQEEKDILCRAYESRGRTLIDNYINLEKSDIKPLTQLKDLVSDIEGLMGENVRNLAAHIKASQMFFETLAGITRDQAPKSNAYSQSGHLQSETTTAPKGLPISIDQTL